MHEGEIQVKENLQTIVWVLSGATLGVGAAIAWFVWRVSKRDSEKKKQKKS